MNAIVSRISLVVFIVLLTLSASLLSLAGERWPWYAAMAIVAVVPLVVGPGRYRSFGVIALVLCGVLIASDVDAGRRLRARHPALQH